MYRNESNSNINNYLTTLITYLTVLGPITMWLIYAGWIAVILKRLLYLRKKRKELKTKNAQSEKITFLEYKYKSEYYKHILLLATILIENFTYIPAVLNIASKHFFPKSIIAFNVEYILRGLSYVTCLVTLCMTNTIIIYMIHISRRYTEFSEIKKRIRRIIIKAVILIFLFLIGLGLLSQILSTIYGSIEYIRIIKNSKYLYSILKEQYRDQICEGNYQVYKAQKYVANIYKWFSVSIFTGISIVLVTLCFEIPISILESAFLIGVLFKKQLFGKGVTSAIFNYRWGVRLMLVVASAEIFLTIIVYSVYLVIRNSRIRVGRKNGMDSRELEKSLIN